MTVENISLDVKTNAGDAARQVRSLSTALAGVRGAGRSVASGGTHKAVSRIGSAAKSSTSAMGKLFSSIKRIAMYRLLRTFLKEITKGFQEGLKNAYAFSQGIDGSLAQALDHLASISGQMKNQMGAAFGELLQTIMPIIEAIVSAITRLMSALSALFAALGGRMQYLSAGETAESWDKATGAAKKYKNTILGFDEINRLNDESGGGGGGGNSGQGAWELADLPDWAEKIRQAIEDGDWKGAGEALADHLNQIIEDWDAYSAGQKLGKKINNAINFIYGFLKRFNSKRLGERIAEFLNGAISEINFETLGGAFTLLFTNAIDFLIGFIERLDTFQLGEAVKGFIVGACNEASAWLDETDFKLLGNTIGYKIIGFFNGLDPAETADAIGGFLSKALSNAADFIRGVNWEKVGETIGSWFRTAFEHVPWAELAQNAWDLLGEAMGGVSGFAGGLLEGAIGQKIEGIVQEITLILSDASLVLGAILLFTGHIPLGLGLIIAGLAGKDKAAEDWDKVPTQVQEKIAAIELAASGAMLALGLILAISGAALPLGLGLIAAGATMLATSASENWNKLPTEVQTQLTLIGLLAGVMLLALGIILLLSGAAAPLGIGIILASVAVLGVTAASFNLDSTKSDINGAMESIGSTGETQFGKIAKAINDIISAVESVINWFGRMKTAISEVNTRLTDIDQHKAMYGSGWGEFVRGSELGLYASGGSIENNGSLFIAGEAGPEIVADMGSRTGVMNVDQMEAAVANGNLGVINAIYGMANMIVKAVDSLDVDVTLDGQSLADKMYRYNQQAANRYGAAMVT